MNYAKPAAQVRQNQLQLPFVLLAVLLCITFLTGGSSWASEAQLSILRPAALILAAVGVWTLSPAHLRHYAAVWTIFSSVVLLTALHLVPLPFEWWSSLPGRQLIVDIDAAAGLGKMSRPLSMAPDGTMNALVSLSIPLAVLILAVQIDDVGQRRILALVLVLTAMSGAIGLLQAAGSNIAFFPRQSETPGLFANRNHQGALLAMIFPIAMAAATTGFALGMKRSMEKGLALALAIIAFPLIIVTGSRSGLLVAIVAIAAIPLMQFGTGVSGKSPARWWKRALALAILGAIASATVFVSRDVAVRRIQNAEDDLRWPVWQSLIDAIPHYMPWGTGVGTYVEAYQVVEPDALLRPRYSNHAHNEWLEIAFTAGIPGLAILMFAAILVVAAIIRGMSAVGVAASFSRLGCVMIILLAFASTTDYPVRTPIMSALLALAAVWASSSGGFVGRSGAELRRKDENR